jgi:hypothetical protein
MSLTRRGLSRIAARFGKIHGLKKKRRQETNGWRGHGFVTLKI